MANNHFLAWVYGESKGDPRDTSQNIDYATARQGNKSFPSTGTVFHALSPLQAFGGVNCNAIIEVIPTALHLHGRKYATDKTVETLNSEAT